MADLPAAFLENIDWVNPQPPPQPPPQAGDTHALHFFLQKGLLGPPPESPPNYQGFLFFRKGTHPTAPTTNTQDGLDGTGRRIFGEVGFPDEAWARVRVRFRTQPTHRIDVVVSLFQPDGPGSLPGTRVRGVEFDVIDPADDGRSILLDPGTSNNWMLHLQKTTVLAGL